MKPASQRLPYLDWVRGFAALVMLQGHVFHSFLRDDLREGGPYVMSQFAGRNAAGGVPLSAGCYIRVPDG